MPQKGVIYSELIPRPLEVKVKRSNTCR